MRNLGQASIDDQNSGDLLTRCACGPTIAGGMLYVNSGYGVFFGQPGNVLLAFAVAGE